MAPDALRRPDLCAFAHATLGVADLDKAVDFWVRNFGFEVTARKDGPDQDLATLWNLAAGEISRQAMVKTQAATAGAMHLVEFARPGPPVRQAARVFDHLPKNLDIYTRDITASFEQLRACGIRFRSEPVSSPGPDGLAFTEVHLHGHDDTNVVLIEITGKGYDIGFNGKGYSGLGPLVTIVPDLAAEAAFYEQVLGMATTLELRLGGPVIEKMIGLPEGASLLLKVYGDPDLPLGRLEIIQYEGTSGRNCFPRARAPALGTLHVAYQLPRLDVVLDRLVASKTRLTDHGRRRLLFGTGRVVSLHSPAGFRIELQETGPT